MPEGSDEESTPSDIFGLVGNEIRTEIIQTLGDARVEEGFPPVLSFSELRSRTETDIVSSQFNYHLQQLVGHYIKRVDDGYQMRPEGRVLYQTLRAGTFDSHESIQAVNAGFDCYYCDTLVEAVIDEGRVTVQCPTCDYLYGIAGAPSGTIKNGSVALDQIGAYYHHRHLSFARDVCVTCGSAPSTELLSPDASPFSNTDRRKLYIYRSCDTCGDQRYLSLGTVLLTDPELISFCYEHGVDVLSTPLWELEFAATDRYVTVYSTDPWEMSLEITYGDDTLKLIVDDDLTVKERNRK